MILKGCTPLRAIYICILSLIYADIILCDNRTNHDGEYCTHGGTAMGTGLNTTEGYANKITAKITKHTSLPFVLAPDLFEALAVHNSIVKMLVSLRPQRDCHHIPIRHHISVFLQLRLCKYNFYSCTTLLMHYFSVLMSNHD